MKARAAAKQTPIKPLEISLRAKELNVKLGDVFDEIGKLEPKLPKDILISVLGGDPGAELPGAEPEPVYGTKARANIHQGSWVVHDLRRTARSLMSRAGVRPDIAERVLGHAISGVEGIYDRHDYRAEKAEALAKLAALVGDITEG